MTMGPYGQGQPYTLADVAAGLMARGISGPALSQAVAIVARENGFSSPNDVRYTGTVNPSEPASVAALGPFQYIQTWHPDFNRAQASQSLDYNLDYFVQHTGRTNDFSPWIIPGHGATEFTNMASPFVQTALSAIAGAGGTGAVQGQSTAAAIGRPPATSAPVAAVGPGGRTYAQITGNPYTSPEERAWYFQQQGTTPPAIAQPAAATPQLGPNGRSFDQITGGAYQSPEERTWYLNQIGKTVDANGNVVDNTAAGGGRAAPRLDTGTTDATATSAASAPAQPTPSFYGTGMPSAGNMTTLNNNTAQGQYDANTLAAQQATQQSYLQSPQVASALGPSMSTNGLGQTVEFGSYGGDNQGSQAAAQAAVNGTYGPQMAKGGSAIVGRSKKKKMEPTLPIGAPFPTTPIAASPSPTMLPSAVNGDVNQTPVTPPVAMPVGMQPGGFSDAMPVNRALDSYWNPQQYASGGSAYVGDPNFDWTPGAQPDMPGGGAAPMWGGDEPGLGGATYGGVPSEIMRAGAIAKGYFLPESLGGGTTPYLMNQGQGNIDPNTANLSESQRLFESPIGPPVLDTPRLQANTRAALEQAGLPGELADIVNWADNRYFRPSEGTSPYGPVGLQVSPGASSGVGGYYAGVANTPTPSGPNSIVTGRYPYSDTGEAGAWQGMLGVHELTHGLEAWMTPAEKLVAEKLSARTASQYPYGGGLSPHFPEVGGLMTGTSPEMLNFLRTIAPALIARAQGSGTIRPKAMPGYSGGGTTTVGPGSVRAPEEIVAVGVQSGRPYFTAGEAGPEKVTIKPMQGGGSADVGLDPNDPRNQAFGSQPFVPSTAPAAPQYNITAPNPYAYAGDPLQNQWNAQNNVYQSRQGEIGASQGVINANTGVLDAQGRTIPLQQGVIDANRSVLDARGNVIPYSQAVINAQRGTIGPQGAYIDAQGNVIGAQEQQTAGERGYIGQQQQANAASTAEEQALQAASHNLPDLAATGAAQSYQDSTDYLYRLGGVVPAEVDTRGEALPAGSPVNVRAKIQSQADILRANNADAQKLRALKLEGARLAVALLGTNVDQAREAAARVGLTVDQAKLLVQQASIEENQAQLGVTQAQIAQGYAGNALDQGQLGVTQAQLAKGYAGNALDQSQLGTSQAQLDLARASQSPASGLTIYTNPFTGDSQWVTPAQRSQLESTIGPSSSAGTATGTSKAAVPDQLKGLTTTQIINLYVDGQIDKSVAYAALAAKGLSSAAAALLIDQEHATRKSYTNPANLPGATGGSTSTGGIDVSGNFR